MSHPFLKTILGLAHQAGDAIMQVYMQDFDVHTKIDKSPLTEADLASHGIISRGLKVLTPKIPVLSEEAATLPWEVRRTWERYWLVDPLDGTKEFVKRNGEFTVNIALIENHRAVMGVVYAPALGLSYWGSIGEGAAYRQQKGGTPTEIHTVSLPKRGETWNVVGSRSHTDERLTRMLTHLGQSKVIPMGSSFKFCKVAEGEAHLYPRLGPTSEWDTAAAQCVVEAAGGSVYTLEPNAPLRYNTKDSLLNPSFLVAATDDASALVDTLTEVSYV